MITRTLIPAVRPLADSARPRSGRVVFAGDSLTASGEDDVAPDLGHVESTQFYAMAASAGRLYYPRTAGVGGDTSAQLLARIQTDVIASAPSICVVMIGTNDVGGSVPLADYQTNVTAIVAALEAANILPVLCLVPPRTGTTAQRLLLYKYNAWLADFGARRGTRVVDTFTPLVDPATGLQASGIASGDGVHLNWAGNQAVGLAVWATLDDLIVKDPLALTVSAADPTDLLGGIGLFTADANADGLADGWTAGDAAHATYSLVDVAGVPGKMQRVTTIGDVGYQVDFQRSITTGFAVGDVLELTGLLTTTQASGHVAQVYVGFLDAPTGLSSIAYSTSHDLTKGSIRSRFTVPPNCTYIKIRIFAGPSAGTTSAGQVRVRNLTALGVA